MTIMRAVRAAFILSGMAAGVIASPIQATIVDGGFETQGAAGNGR